ncbi:undecaprenyl/decaprenyl-phosphate alpha-N-acetylglucosaminyl 1-phosphate transferase, partial [Patescibacteria group bacterium]|nr:undecaprenyl/decaprenyl-phosphate alpha-N-acetylglucosaminyl 1-phosphate transferase [Patescibacteria group bacterium]
CALLLSIIFTLLVKNFAIRRGIVDKPDLDRKIHRTATPLLGGMAIFLSFFLVLYFVRDKLLAGDLEARHWLGFFAGACFLMIGGFLDDKYNLKPKQQIIFPILAIIAVIIGGVGIEKITNPFGGLIHLDQWRIPVMDWGGGMRYFMVLADGFAVLWLMGMMYTTKLLDGVDGLVTGVTAIGGIIIFLFTMTTKYYQPDIGLAALILAGACLGFLIFNWHPAKIFLGEGGSLLLGYVLGVLAIISGGKIAIALLIMGIPIMDAAWTIIRRLAQGKNPFSFADKSHLHHRFLSFGLTQRQTVLIYYFLAGGFGLSALFLQSAGKLFALAVLILLMLLIVIGFTYFTKKVE